MMLKYELKKIFSKKINILLVIVVFLLAVVYSVFAIKSITYVEQDGKEYNGILAARKITSVKNKYKGDISPKLIEQIVSKRQSLNKTYPNTIPNDIYAKDLQAIWDIEDMINSVLTADGEYNPYAILNIEEKDVLNFYSIYKTNLQKMADEYSDTLEQKKFLTKLYSGIKTPFYYEAADSFHTMFMYATTFGLLLVLIVTIPVSSIFTDEFTYKAESILFSSKYGRTRAVRVKVISGIVVATGIYWGGVLLLSIISFSVMGISGFSVSYCFDHPYSIYNVSLGEQYILILFSGYIACLLSALISMLIASKTRKSPLAIFVSFLLFAVSPFIARAFDYKTFFTLTPDSLMNIINSAKIPYIYQINTVVFRQIPFIMCFYSLLVIMFMPLVYRVYKKQSWR